jgi:hypothetical protein
MAGWQEAVKPHVVAGKLAVIGVVQEQHSDRARLYKQWKRIDWPLYIDSLNTLGLAAVPVPLGIDESGVVRLEGAAKEGVRDFVEKEFPKSGAQDGRAEKPDPARLSVPRDRGDFHFLYDESPEALDRAIKAYDDAVKADDRDARSLFRLGVAYRARYDSSRRQPRDVQKAVEYWQQALALGPNMYIWRRRLQQFGPRLDKPYDFYFWVEEARRDIVARGEKPVDLVAEPVGSEVAPPARGPAGAVPAIPDPDPQGRIVRDRSLVTIEPSVVPARVRPGSRVRVRVAFRLGGRDKPHWNNEADPLTLSVNLPDGVTLIEGTFIHAKPKEAESLELRILEFEAAVGEGVKAGVLEIAGYALYDVCEEVGGVCRHLRQDLKIPFAVDPTAPKIQ